MIHILLFHEISSFSQPLDQFEITVIFFYWSGVVMLVGPAVVTNLTIVFFLYVLSFRILWSSFENILKIRKFLLTARNVALKSIARSHTSFKTYPKAYSYVYLFFSLIWLYSNSQHGAQGGSEFGYVYQQNYQLIFILASSIYIMGVMMMGNNNNHQKSDPKENADHTEEIQKIVKKEESFFTWKNLLWVSLGVGLGMVAVGVVIYLSNGGNPPSGAAPAPNPIQLTPMFTHIPLTPSLTPVPRIHFDFVLPGDIPLHLRPMRPLTYTEIIMQILNTIPDRMTNGRRP